MKKLVLAICLTIGLSACANKSVECEKKAPVKPQPAVAQPVAQSATCTGCQGTSYTVSEPVEVIYKNTVYKTVYEPKTYSTVSFVKKPYNCAQDGLCKQNANQQ